MIRAAAVLLVAALLCGCNALIFLDEAPGGGVVELSRASFHLSDQAAPPALEAPGWAPMELPDRWGRRGLTARGGWYRLRFSASASPTEVCGVYLWRLHMNAAVYFNGVFLGDGGRMGDPLTRNWNTPLYFTIPPPLWRAGDNEVTVRLRTYPGYGMLSAVQVGPERLLRPRYELRRFLQIEVSAILCAGLVALSLFLLAVWGRHRKDTVPLWLSGASLLWALFSTYLFVRSPDVPGRAHQWLAHACLDWWIVVFAGFVHRFAGVCRPRLERLLFVATALGTVASTALHGERGQIAAFVVSHALSLGIAIYLAAFAAAAWWRRRSADLSLLAGALGFLALVSAHDFVGFVASGFVSQAAMRAALGKSFFFSLYAAPLVFFAFAWHLTRRFADALRESEQLNAELEGRVAAGRRDLERSFAARGQLEREQAAVEARERVYRDLHDDIGAKLLSLVIGADSPGQADLARAALQDLRDIVSHSARGPAPLCDLLGDWRSELEGRANAARLHLLWEQAPDLPDAPLRADAALHLGRILREAVSNVLRHARARAIHVRVSGAAGHLVLSVQDDGLGGVAAGAREGRGMRNIRARAGLLGGEVRWQEVPPRGCLLELRVSLEPLRPPPPEVP